MPWLQQPPLKLGHGWVISSQRKNMESLIYILIPVNISVIVIRDWENKCSLQWRHNERDGVSNNQRLDCLLNRLFRRRSKKTPELRATGLCEGNSPVTGEFPSQRASNAENVSIWWRHHVKGWYSYPSSRIIKCHSHRQAIHDIVTITKVRTARAEEPWELARDMGNQ